MKWIFVSLVISFSALAKGSVFEGCWKFRQEDYPTSSAQFRIEKKSESAFKVLIYQQEQWFTSVPAKKRFEVSQDGDKRGLCILEAYVPQDEKTFPYSVTFTLYLRSTEAECRSEDFVITTGNVPDRFDSSKSLTLIIHKNQQMMFRVSSYEPLKTECNF